MILSMTEIVQGGLRQELKLETIANHLANASTTAFKGDVLSFDDQFRATMSINFKQGDVRRTGNDLDLAIRNDGFFKIQTDQGIRYTRNGTFTLDSDNQLVTMDGDPVLGETGTVTIEGSNFQINEAGEIIVKKEVIDKLDIVTFDAKDNLEKEGTSLFSYQGDAENREVAAEGAEVIQGALEMPNISPIVEMTRMIETHRSYESYQKMLRAYDETDSKLINEIGKA